MSTPQLPTRDDAWALLCEHTETLSLRRHALGVEQVMRELAPRYGGDPEMWGIAGLLHDFDYEKHPSMEEHPYFGNRILTDLGYPEEVRTAIMGHAPYTGTARMSEMAKALYATDEITGFIFAVTYVRPSKSIREVSVESVRKKLKQKSFAASVNREDIERGVQELGVPLDEHIRFVIDALAKIAGELGLAGAPPSESL